LFIPAHTIPLIRRPDLKTVVTIHDVGFQEYLETYQRWWGRLYEGRVSNYAARNATHLIAVSESTKKDLVEKVGVASEKITVIYEGVNHGIFRQQFIDSPKANRRLQANLAIEQLRRKYGIDGDYLLFVGTVQPRKNLARLIDAFSLLTSHFPLLNLVIVGKKGWLSDEVYAAPQKFGVGERVKFLGYVPTEDIVSLMNGAKAFVFPSLYEGFGLVVLEAMACGCPVVASNISSLPEVVEDAGILVDPYRVEDIARGVKEVLELNGEERQNLVQKGLVQARKFTWEKAARETVKIFTLVYDRNLRS
jgi:glycosyltransferase involved in cell wall biosynthesis